LESSLRSRRLTKDGARWTVGKLLTWEKKFPLNDLLTQQKPDVDEDGMLVYCAGKNPRIRTDILTHFGIFWTLCFFGFS